MTKWLFRIFVFLLPTQLAFHFWPKWAFIFGIRVDYLSPTIYLTDILFLLTLASAIISKKISLKARRTNPFWALSVIAIVLINITGAASPPVAIFKWAKVLEFYLVFLLAKNFGGLDFKKDFLKPLFVSVALFSGVGILQFLKGGTLGPPFYLLGERTFSLLTPGIALIGIAGRDFLRAYSTLPHPNSLAGQLSLALIFFLTQKKKVFSNGTNFVIVALVVLGLLLSFSLGAWLALLATYLLFFFRKIGTPVLVFTIVFSLTLPVVFQGEHRYPFPESFEKRVELALISEKMVFKNPLFGIGLNNFIVNLASYSRNPEVSWFLQPVHNIYLLTLSETGIFGLAGLFLILNKGIKAAAKRKNKGIFLCLCFVILVGAVDHYFLTIQQNLLFLSLILGYSQRRE